MPQTLKFKKLKFDRPFKGIMRSFQRDAKKLPEREAAFTRRRARSIMKKAPKKPKSLYGNYRMYTQSTYAKRQARFAARGKNSTQGYWRKGLYSRPGHPPFYHDSQAQFNLRTIVFGPITGSPKIPTPSTRAGDVYAWRVGPVYNVNGPMRSTPIPALHEYGGTIRLQYNRRRPTYKDRGIRLRYRNQRKGEQVRYAARPYMRPAAKEARESAARKAPNSLRKITKLGGWQGRRIY